MQDELKRLKKSGKSQDQAIELVYWSLVLCASYYGQEACLRILAVGGADCDEVMPDGLSPLIHAVLGDDANCARLLIASRCDLAVPHAVLSRASDVGPSRDGGVPAWRAPFASVIIL